MGLFGSIQMGGNTLRAMQIGLQVVGNNIANANTPGYVREEVVLAPAPSQRLGNLRLGMGVQVNGVVQKIDRFLEGRLRSAVSDRAGGDVLQETYAQLESLIGELGDTDLSTALNNFFDDRSRAPAQIAELKAYIASLAPDRRALMVSHGVVISALTGIAPREGEFVVLRLDGKGGFSVAGRLWAE